MGTSTQHYSEMPLNMQPLSRSRRRPRPGDVFTFFIDSAHMFGRVIVNDADASFGPGAAIVIYVFKFRSKDKQLPPPEALQTSQLLIPPAMTNRLGWSRGYFDLVENVEFRPGERLDQHCFADYDLRVPAFYDEYLRPLPDRLEPCSRLGLDSYASLDDKISKALGIPLADGA